MITTKFGRSLAFGCKFSIYLMLTKKTKASRFKVVFANLYSFWSSSEGVKLFVCSVRPEL